MAALEQGGRSLEGVTAKSVTRWVEQIVSGELAEANNRKFD